MMEESSQSPAWRKVLASCLPKLEPTPGSTLTILLSLVISIPAVVTKARGGNVETKLDLQADVLESMSVYRLITYSYFNEDLPTLICSCLLIWYFGGGFEENLGTVKFCFLTPLFAVSAGVLYLAVITSGIISSVGLNVQGFTTVAFSMISVFTLRTSLRRFILCGFMIPIRIMPIMFLLLAIFIPHAPVISNVCGILVGTVYGFGGCFFMDPSESLLSRIDQMLPYRALKYIRLWKYIPATLAERNASQNRKLNPPPGSYPVQQYYTPPQGFQETYSPYHHMKAKGTWPPTGVSNYPVVSVPGDYHHHNVDGSGGHSHHHIVTSDDFGSVSQKDSGISSSSQTELVQIETR
ncbi:rhomboid domain-containing protein 2 [Hyperolius riggenbachi]|uniref:rhomboid domain-containing protein 2 n=1 Tax=Hyperolius riggenbachi TaxID=752182 RepID=UPI0035A2EA21